MSDRVRSLVRRLDALTRGPGPREYRVAVEGCVAGSPRETWLPARDAERVERFALYVVDAMRAEVGSPDVDLDAVPEGSGLE